MLAGEIATTALCTNFMEYEGFVRQLLFLGLQNQTVFADGRQASLAVGKIFGSVIRSHRPLIVHDAPEDAVEYICSPTFSACAHRISHGQMLESTSQCPWGDLIERLVQTNQAYLFCRVEQDARRCRARRPRGVGDGSARSACAQSVGEPH
jgi:hypothetical protein